MKMKHPGSSFKVPTKKRLKRLQIDYKLRFSQVDGAVQPPRDGGCAVAPVDPPSRRSAACATQHGRLRTPQRAAPPTKTAAGDLRRGERPLS